MGFNSGFKGLINIRIENTGWNLKHMHFYAGHISNKTSWRIVYNSESMFRRISKIYDDIK